MKKTKKPNLKKKNKSLNKKKVNKVKKVKKVKNKKNKKNKLNNKLENSQSLKWKQDLITESLI